MIKTKGKSTKCKTKFAYASNLTSIQIDNTPGSIEGAPWGATIGDRAVEWLRDK